jgi:hypothetical protein
MTWDKLPRFSKLASCVYPHLTEKERRDEMTQILRGEKRKAPAGPTLLSNERRGAVSPLGNVAVGWDKLKGRK